MLIKTKNKGVVDKKKLPQLNIVKGVAGQTTYNYNYYLSNHAKTAELFIIHFDFSVRYCPKTSIWYLWQEDKWIKDDKNYINNMVIELSNFIIKDCRGIEDSKYQNEIASKANSLGNLTKIKSVIEVIKTNPHVATLATEFDNNDSLAGLNNGVYDLTKCEFRKAQKQDMVTESMGVNFDASASCPKWLEFLDDIFEGNQELIDYMQTVIGYSLSGNIDEQAIWFIHGNGSNGKSVFFSIIQNLFGTYYTQAQSSLFDKTDKNMNEAKMMLKGKRLAIGTELERGIRLDIKTVKDLTGGEPITGRNLYERSITYQPTAKIFTFGNHKFSIADTDPALWRRFVVIPFLRNFTGTNRKNGLVGELLLELDGIFNWAVEGYKIWNLSKNTKKLAFDIPHICKTTKDEYMYDEDYIAQFIEECVIVGDTEDTSCRISTKGLYDMYSLWCEEDGVKAKTKKNFSTDIKSKGFKQIKSGQSKWIGLKDNRANYDSKYVQIIPDDSDDINDILGNIFDD